MEKELSPEMRQRLNNMLNQLVKEPNKDGFEFAIESFFSQEFNPLLAKNLVAKYKAMMGVKDLDSLPEKEQLNFAEKIIQKIFGRIKKNEALNEIRLHFYINLCITKGAKKFGEKIRQKTFLDLEKIENISGKALLDFFEKLEKEIFMLKINLTDFVDATSYFMIFREDAIKIGDMMNLGKPAEEQTIGFDEKKASSVKEFLNMLVYYIGSSIENIFGGKFAYKIAPLDPSDKEMLINDIKELFLVKGEKGFEKSLKNTFIIENKNLGKIESTVFLLMDKTSQKIKSFLQSKVQG